MTAQKNLEEYNKSALAYFWLKWVGNEIEWSLALFIFANGNENFHEYNNK